MSHKGRCFCGSVEIEVSGSPEGMGYCHCSSCRTWSGGPVNAFTLWKSDNVRVTKGEDLLEMPPLAGVEVMQGDFREDETLQALLARLGQVRVDLVLSDLAPNMSGMRTVDQPRSMYLAELVLDFAGQVLRERGNMVVKLFQGEGFQEYISAVRSRFESVRMRKPPASRAGNRETYLVARNFRL